MQCNFRKYLLIWNKLHIINNWKSQQHCHRPVLCEMKFIRFSILRSFFFILVFFCSREEWGEFIAVVSLFCCCFGSLFYSYWWCCCFCKMFVMWVCVFCDINMWCYRWSCPLFYWKLIINRAHWMAPEYNCILCQRENKRMDACVRRRVNERAREMSMNCIWNQTENWCKIIIKSTYA